MFSTHKYIFGIHLKKVNILYLQQAFAYDVNSENFARVLISRYFANAKFRENKASQIDEIKRENEHV